MEEPGAHYHVMARGTERRDIFTGDQEREKFLSLVGHLLEKYGVDWKQICQRHGDMGRDGGLLMGRQCSGMTLEELGQRGGEITYAAACEAIRRMDTTRNERTSGERKD
jgi:hypothetical protein